MVKMMQDIQNFIKRYLYWREEQKDRELVEREARLNWFKIKLGTKKQVDNLTKKELFELFENLWALNFWHDKTRKVNELLSVNGIKQLKAALATFLYSDEPIAKRWDSVRKSIKGLGPSAWSEILAFVYPEQFGIMNSRSLKILSQFGFFPERKNYYPNVSGSEYEMFMDQLQKFRKYLIKNGFPQKDFLEVDFFIWYLSKYDHEFLAEKSKSIIPDSEHHIEEKLVQSKIDITSEINNISTHSEAEFVLLKLGQILGYKTFSPDGSKEAYGRKLKDFITLDLVPQFTIPELLDTIKNIDVIWFDEEFPVCCFEVEHTTGVTSGLLRLYQTSPLNTKLFVIAPSDVLKKFETELNKMPFRSIKNRYIFRSYEELIQFYHIAENYVKYKNEFFKE